jgi:triacylglycerol lipase
MVFTGEPSLVARAFVAGLRSIQPVLSFAGITLNGSRTTIPFITDGTPPSFVTYGLDVKSSEYAGWTVWTLTPARRSGKIVVAIHGGSFISQASILHWWTYAGIARDTGATVIVPLYPLANEEGTGGTAATVVPVVADFIAGLVGDSQHGGAERVSVLGDSAGGAIALAAIQELARRRAADPDGDHAEQVPGRVVLIAPVLDAGLSNPNAELVDDLLLSPAASRSNGRLWAGMLDIEDPVVSPVFGSLEGLSHIAVYAGSLDLRAPDVLVAQRMAAATPGADFTFELRKGQVHDWIIFAFLPDARAERPGLYRHLGLRTTA